MSKILALTSCLILFIICSPIALNNNVQAKRFGGDDYQEGFGEFEYMVKREQRKTLVDNEYGQISAVNISDGIRGPYHIRFFTLEPNSLLLPVLLHADMVFYVNTGSGRLCFADEEETKTVNLKRGDIFRLQTGSVFFVQSDLEPERQSLRLYALFSNTDHDIFEPRIGAYSSIRNLVRGFDKITLKQAFQVSDEVIESITSATDSEDIVHAISTKKDEKEDKKKKKKKKEKDSWEIETRLLKAFLGLGRQEETAFNKKKDKKDVKGKGKGYNLFDEEPDFENCNGWSLTVNPTKAERVLGETNVGIFMVNLTKGSMMGPHWNPKATEIAIVLQGQGMVRVVCSSGAKKAASECKNARFMVKEGDVFAVPRFHPMAQMSFNNDSLVFMGFTTTRRENHPQFLAGRQSVLRTLDRDVLALSFNVPNTTIDQLLAPQTESLILDCTSCAEEEERKMEEEIEKEKKEEEAREHEKEEEERRKREEEERAREEEERRKREEEEEARRREEERRKREEEEARKREEEERAREEEERREREEEEARKREEEERAREEEERRKREEEEEARKREEEERRQEEERERERQQEEEQEQERRRQEEEQARRQEEERERQRQQEEEARRQEEEQERRQQEEESRRQEEEQERRRREEEEEARQQEEEIERQRQQEEEGRRQEEAQERQRREEEEEKERGQEEEEEGGGGRAYVKMWRV